MRALLSFFLVSPCFLLSAVMLALLCHGPARAEDGITPERILVGVSNVQDGQTGFLGRELLKGARAYFSFINDNGGIFGRKIQVIDYDDGYSQRRCISNTQKLLREAKVFLLFGYVGTPTAKAVLPLVTKENVPFFFPFTGAEFLRDMHQAPTVLNLRASYEREALAMVARLEQLGKKRLAVFFQEDAYGRTGLFGVQKALARHPSVELVAQSGYKRNTLAVNSSLIAILKARPDAVLLVGPYKPCAEFIKRAYALGLRDATFMNISFVGSKALAEELGSSGDGVLVSQVVPLPWDDTIPAVAEYQRLMLASDPLYQPGFVSLEGFLDAKLLVRLLQLAGSQPTREKLLHATRNAYDIDIGLGTNISFSPMDNQGLKRVYLTQIVNDSFEAL